MANAESSVQKRGSLRASWLGLAFLLSDRMLVVGRKRPSGGIHLTISWGNASGELDIHLKREPVAPGEDPYTPLVRIGADRLARAGQHFNASFEPMALSMMAHWRPVRPGWLERNEYGLTLIEKEPPDELLRPFAPRRHRGKHQLTFAPLRDPQYAAKFAERLFYARILRDLDPESVQLPVRATSTRRNRPPLLIAPFTVDGHSQWFMCAEHRTREGMDLAVARLISLMADAIDPGHVEIFRRITDELGLDDIPELEGFIVGVNEFLTAPQELVAKARRQAMAWTPAKHLHPECLARRWGAREE
ncbi:MAG: hypothetical protein ABI488_05685 [Polyangiaceae bacterium]